MKLPLISVIVPTHQRASLLRRSLQSIRAQDAAISREIIVVSDITDGETDAVCAAALTGNDTYVRRSGRPGPSASRNLALSIARGQFVMFLDDDDAWHAGCLAGLAAQGVFQREQPVYFDCSVAVERRLPGGTELISESTQALAGRLTKDIFVKNQVPNPCFTLPRSIMDGLSFDCAMRAYEDWDFMLSICERDMPTHVPVLGARIYKAFDDPEARRGSSADANNFNAMLDYIYTYRRHPAPDRETAEKRVLLLQSVGFNTLPEFL